MEISHYKHYPHTPFSVKTEVVKNSPGTWNSTKVSIYRDDKLIGEYIRNYSDYGTSTFYPFELNGKWYALYSANYTATCVMKLHADSIEDWCGEKPHAHGFCPVEYYIPTYAHHRYSSTIVGKTEMMDLYYVDCDFSEEEFTDILNNPDYVGTLKNCNFAFMAGCVWGDDTSWKLQYIDLSQVDKKILNITEKFGYFELPNNLTLRQCVDMSNWEPDYEFVRLSNAKSFDLSKE